MSANNPRADPIRKVAVARLTGTSTTHLSEEEAGTNAQAIDTLVQALGGRPALLDTLAVAADAPEVEGIISLLIDPRYEKRSIRSLCHMAGLTVVDLFAALKKAMVTRAHLLAYQAITDAIVPVVEDVMRRAAPYEIPCYGCGGLGTVTDPEQPDADPTRCSDCHGSGKLLQLPDLDRQKLALELAQLVQKSAGLNIQQNTVNLPAGGAEGSRVGGTLVELQQVVRDLLSGPRQPILDAEPVREGETHDGESGDPAPDPIPPLQAPPC